MTEILVARYDFFDDEASFKFLRFGRRSQREKEKQICTKNIPCIVHNWQKRIHSEHPEV
jgi:hypothetical protein